MDRMYPTRGGGGICDPARTTCGSSVVDAECALNRAAFVNVLSTGRLMRVRWDVASKL
jgi:hypothetical protein